MNSELNRNIQDLTKYQIQENKFAKFYSVEDLFRFEPQEKDFSPLEKVLKKSFTPKIEIFSAFKQPFSVSVRNIVSEDAEYAAACCACTACTACR